MCVAKKLDQLICKLDNLNQRNQRDKKIDDKIYNEYRELIHKIYDINKGDM